MKGRKKSRRAGRTSDALDPDADSDSEHSDDNELEQEGEWTEDIVEVEGPTGIIIDPFVLFPVFLT